MFKIFIHSGGQGVKYYCGKKVIKPASEVNEANVTLAKGACIWQVLMHVNGPLSHSLPCSRFLGCQQLLLLEGALCDSPKNGYKGD